METFIVASTKATSSKERANTHGGTVRNTRANSMKVEEMATEFGNPQTQSTPRFIKENI